MAQYLFEELAEEMTTMLDQYQRIRWKDKHPITQGEWWFIIGCYDMLWTGRPSVEFMDMVNRLSQGVQFRQYLTGYSKTDTGLPDWEIFEDTIERFTGPEEARYVVDEELEEVPGSIPVDDNNLMVGVESANVWQRISKRIMDLIHHNSLARPNNAGAEITLNLCIQCARVVVSTRSNPQCLCSSYCKNQSSQSGLWSDMMDTEGYELKGGGKTKVGQYQQYAFSKLLAKELCSLAYRDYYRAFLGTANMPELGEVPTLNDRIPMGMEVKRKWGGWGTIDFKGERATELSFGIYDHPTEEDDKQSGQLYVEMLQDLARRDPAKYMGPQGDELRAQLEERLPSHPLTQNHPLFQERRKHYFTNYGIDDVAVQYRQGTIPVDTGETDEHGIDLFSEEAVDAIAIDLKSKYASSQKNGFTTEYMVDMQSVRQLAEDMLENLEVDKERWSTSEYGFELPVVRSSLDPEDRDVLMHLGYTEADLASATGEKVKFDVNRVSMTDLNKQTLRQRNMVRLKEALETAKDSLKKSNKELQVKTVRALLDRLRENVEETSEQVNKRSKSLKNHS